MKTSLHLCITAVLVFFLASCGTLLVNPELFWKIKITTRERCKSIAGEYQNGPMLLEFLTDQSNIELAKKFSSIEHAKRLPYNGLPFDRLPQAKEDFNKTAILEVDRFAAGWRLVMRDGSGQVHTISTVFEQHQRVGCDKDKNLVLRNFSNFAGSEGTGGSASAAEVVFYRSEDGTLKVRRMSRIWNGSSMVPVSEMERVTHFAVVP